MLNGKKIYGIEMVWKWTAEKKNSSNTILRRIPNHEPCSFFIAIQIQKKNAASIFPTLIDFI